MPAEPRKMQAEPRRMTMELRLIPVEPYKARFIPKEPRQFAMIALVCIPFPFPFYPVLRKDFSDNHHALLFWNYKFYVK
jgi:hypothetical protein